MRGDGVAQDLFEAAKWYRKAAGQGNADAQLNLGLAYTWGDGVARDPVEAYAWFDLAAATLPRGADMREWLALRIFKREIARGQKLSGLRQSEIVAKQVAK